MKRLEGKVCIVTGAAQGLGRAVVDTFVREGAKAIIAIDIQDATYDAPQVKPVKQDTTDKAGITAVVDAVWKEFGRIDVIVNNAGITRDALCHKMTEEQWNLVIDINMKAPHYMVAAASQYLMEQGFGSIITTSSVIGLYGNVGQVNYAATKAGVIAMSKSWTKELSRRGAPVRSNIVAPGFILTPILQSMPSEILDGMKEKVLFKQLGEPQNIADAVLFFASDESSFVTGQVLEISGGLSI